MNHVYVVKLKNHFKSIYLEEMPVPICTNVVDLKGWFFYGPYKK